MVQIFSFAQPKSKNPNCMNIQQFRIEIRNDTQQNKKQDQLEGFSKKIGKENSLVAILKI